MDQCEARWRPEEPFQSKPLKVRSSCFSGKVMFFFSRIFIIFPPLPPKYWVAIGCTEIGQQMGVIVHKRYNESFCKSLAGERWVAVDNNKKKS